MTKYLIVIVLLASLALENKNIFNRLYAKSHPSGDFNAVTPFMRQHQYRHHTQHQSSSDHHPTHDQHLTHHARKHVRQHQRHNGDNGEEEDTLAQERQRDMERVKRHMEQQRTHHKEHDKRAHQRSQRPVYSEETLRTMPRIWQHLSMVYDYDEDVTSERMFGDDPAKGSLEYEYNDHSDPEMPPSVEDTDLKFNKTYSVTKHHSEDKASRSGNHKSNTTRCPKCESSRKVESVSEEELTRLRIEFVKQQILEKLRLKERPNVSAVRLPKPISEGVTIEQEDYDSSKKDLDDYYARTSKKFIFLEAEKDECLKLGSEPSMCFSFKLDDTDSDGYEVSKAVLWIFKNNHKKFHRHHHSNKSHPHTITVSEVQQTHLDSNQQPNVKTIAVQAVHPEDEWMKIDIEWPIKGWLGNHQLSHLIQITCHSCDITAMEHMISTDKDYRPFIVVDTQSRRRQTRQKRNINCANGVTECCREKLYISFKDIGWDDWIIQPEGYDAYFCRGSCNSVASVASSASQHSSVIQKLMNKPGQRFKNLELVPCCTAKQYSSLQLLFTVNNETATLKTFPNMVVESCGCR